ncbi:hypothetical protein [Streptomyces abikoensis]|uniref:hypothetical protein n=1 Tax=Streptomyces abikoensis TaxID=97398 RepID=UPI001675D2E8|nr:hypothetical protein [Streptomyces abikoensis]GGP66675.1 hypothetical protein GCM10010214_46120 [Streptomyces abikoensis]
MFGKRGMAVALGSLLLVGSTVVWAPAGQAGTGEGEGRGVTCTGSGESRYAPPLTLVPQPTHVHGDITYTCTVAPGHTVPATGSSDSDLPEAVCVAVSGGSGVETVRYADGRRSLIVYDNATTVRTAGVLLLEQSGHVVEGRGKGHPVRRTVAGPPRELPTDCLTSGLRGWSNGVQLEIQP